MKNRRKIIAFLCAVLLCLQSFAVQAAVFAEGPEVGDNDVGRPTGTPNACFRGYTAVGNKEELLAIRPDGNYYLTADIVFTDADFDVGGIAEGRTDLIRSFSGIFDGAYHTISGLRLRSDASAECGDISVGMFGNLTGTIQRLNLTDCKVTVWSASGNVAMVAGTMRDGHVIDCTVDGRIEIGGTSDFRVNVGAIAGECDGCGTIEKCVVNAEITVEHPTSTQDQWSDLGGICGNLVGHRIEDCFFTGSLKNVGRCEKRGSTDGIGGIVGAQRGCVERCCFAGRIEWEEGTPSAIAGYFPAGNSSSISACIALDSVPLNLALKPYAILFSVKSVSAGSLFHAATYTDWDFESVWEITEGESYPSIRKNGLNITYVDFNFGDGSEEDPFLVESKEQLRYLPLYPYAHFELVADLELTAQDQLQGRTLADLQKNRERMKDGNFYGTFEGNGHTVTEIGLNIRRDDEFTSVGYLFSSVLFGQNHGTIRNLNVQVDLDYSDVDSTLSTGRNYHMYLGTVTESNYGSIENVHVSGRMCLSDFAMPFRAKVYAGSICAINEGLIRNCSSSMDLVIDLSMSGYEFQTKAGGICGLNARTVEFCSNTGRIYVASCQDISVGGVCGTIDYGDHLPSDIYKKPGTRKCMNSGEITAICIGRNFTAIAGGIAGSLKGIGLDIEDCVNFGFCTAFSDARRIGPDYYNTYPESYSGGIVGYALGSQISRCYNTGGTEAYAIGVNKMGCACRGGIAGYALDAGEGYDTERRIAPYFSDCVNLDAVGVPIGNPDEEMPAEECFVNCVNASAEEMYLPECYPGFDLESVWEFPSDGGNSFPLLRGLSGAYRKEPVSLRILSRPLVTEYIGYSEYSTEGLSVEILYNDGTTEIPDPSTYTVTLESERYGVNAAIVEYRSGSHILTDYFTVSIYPKPIASVSVSSPPDRTEYDQFEWIDISGAELTVNYTDGTSEVLPVESYMLDTVFFMDPGEKTVVVDFFGTATAFTVQVADSGFRTYLYACKVYSENNFDTVILTEATINDMIIKLNLKAEETFSEDLSGKRMEADDAVSTGACIVITKEHRIVGALTLVRIGDINGDGIVDEKDTEIMMNAMIGGADDLAAYYRDAADFDGDGILTLKDLLQQSFSRMLR